MGANGRRGAGVGAGEKERPVLYDVYVGKRDGDGDEGRDAVGLALYWVRDDC